MQLPNQDSTFFVNAANAILANFAHTIYNDEDHDLTKYGNLLPSILRNLFTEHPNALALNLENWNLSDEWKNAEQWIDLIPQEMAGLSELIANFELTREDAEILILLAGLQLSQTSFELFIFLTISLTERPHCLRLGALLDILSIRNIKKREIYWERFKPEKPLSAHRLINWIDDANTANDRRQLHISNAVLSFLRTAATDNPSLPDSLFHFSTRISTSLTLDDLYIQEDKQNELRRACSKKNAKIILKGPKGTQKSKTSAILANMSGRGLLSIELAYLFSLGYNTLHEKLIDIQRESILYNDFVYLQYCELPLSLPQENIQLFHKYFKNLTLIIGISETTPWLYDILEEVVEIDLPLPSVSIRETLWTKAFEKSKNIPDQTIIKQIARRYALSSTQIPTAAYDAIRIAKLNEHKAPTLQDLDNACRRFFSHHLSDFAELVPTILYPRERLILEDELTVHFNTIVEYLAKNHIIFDKWGFNAYYPNDTGLCMLFYGPPGTGKTMAACVIGNIFAMDLYRIDVSRIMNRYIGETEKNLARIFDEAEKSHVILLFDEADSLFSKRTQVKSSVDKYSNTEVTYLLQRMEQYRGIVILTTNEEKNLDEAFKRRLGFRLHFAKPEAKTRAHIFKYSIPPSAPVRPDIPYDLLAKTFDLSGGNIKKATLRAAFYAASENEPISLKHLVRACLEELREDERLISQNLNLEMERALNREANNKITIESLMPQLNSTNQ